MALMALAGMTASTIIFLSTVAQQFNVPYYAMSGVGCLMSAAALALAIGEGFGKLDLCQWMWVWLLGALNATAEVLVLMAVAVGAPQGDTMALNSINIVVATIFGRIFLGEPMQLLHIVAVVFCVLGAVLVSRPEASPELDIQSMGIARWLGSLLAIGSGGSDGALLVAARKAQGVSPLITTCSVFMHQGPALMALSLAGVVTEAPLEGCVAAPFRMLLFLAVVMLLNFTIMGAYNAGSQLCPPAASSIVFTGVAMPASYVAQMFVHHKSPGPLTTLGAMFLLLAVALMAMARRQYPAPTSESCPAAEPPCP